MIDSFETTLLEVLGLVADFDPEYAQWSCKLSTGSLRLDLIYSLDGTVSTSLYLDDRLLAFNYATGLQSLSITRGEIFCDIVSGVLNRTLRIDTKELKVTWQDC
ncbi:TPA: hypothetical protein ACKP22_001891 [Pseudomonas putida]